MKTLVRPIISEKFQKTAGTILNSLDYDDSKQIREILANVMERGACLKSEKMALALGAMLIVYGNILLDRYQTIYGDAGVLKDRDKEEILGYVKPDAQAIEEERDRLRAREGDRYINEGNQ